MAHFWGLDHRNCLPSTSETRCGSPTRSSGTQLTQCDTLTTKPKSPNTLIGIVLSLATLGCTSIYQVRGVEPELVDHIAIDQLEDKELPEAQRRELLEALEARSVEPLKLCPSGTVGPQTSGQCSEPAEAFKIGVLEVNSNGSLNPKQRRQVFQMLDDEAEEAIEEKQNLVILVFIHGWHHGANVCDYNLACFRRLVGGLANVHGPSRSDKRRASRFVGIYFAWRGESIDKEGVSFLTIYHRKRKAEHIGRSGATNLLLDLDDKYRSLKAAAKKKHGDVLMVTTGHSLGGGMLLSALQSKLVGVVDGAQYIRSSRPLSDGAPDLRPVVSGFGDLSILINPAIEASRFEAFANDLTKVVGDKDRRYSDEQTPVLLVLSSKADSANRRAFPQSQLLLPWKWFKGAAKRKALGHYQPYRTHELSYSKPVDHTYPKPPCGCPFYVVGRALAEVRHPTVSQGTFGVRVGTGLADNGFKLTRVFKPGWDENAPFWVVHSDASVISSHNDIYNEAALGFISLFLNTFFAAKGF